MIIDFHTHMFPDKIAGRTLDYLSGIFGASPFADGTYTGLCNSMGKGAVDISIALPAVTKVSQVASINRFASAYTEGPVISFGGIHPECENYKEILKEIKNLGLKGIKLHPDFQRFHIDDHKAFCIYEAISGRLPLLVHTGDFRYQWSKPERMAKVMDEFPAMTVIGAHFGGWSEWDDAARVFKGKNIYVDTSSTMYSVPPEHINELIRQYGTDHVLFGSDYPMWDAGTELEYIEKLDLTNEERELILHKNTERILGI